jgi:hypothetical protein
VSQQRRYGPENHRELQVAMKYTWEHLQICHAEAVNTADYFHTPITWISPFMAMLDPAES